MPRYLDPDVPVGPDSTPLVSTLPLRWSNWLVPVLDTSAYAAGDALHIAPLLRLSGILPAPNYQTIVKGLIVEDSTGTPQNIGVTLWIFDRPQITLPALNAAWTLVAADREALVACISSGPYNTSTATGRSENFTLSTPLWSPRGSNDGDLWVLAQTLGAPTYAASSLRMRLVVQD